MRRPGTSASAARSRRTGRVQRAARRRCRRRSSMVNPSRAGVVLVAGRGPADHRTGLPVTTALPARKRRRALRKADADAVGEASEEAGRQPGARVLLEEDDRRPRDARGDDRRRRGVAAEPDDRVRARSRRRSRARVRRCAASARPAPRRGRAAPGREAGRSAGSRGRSPSAVRRAPRCRARCRRTGAPPCRRDGAAASATAMPGNRCPPVPPPAIMSRTTSPGLPRQREQHPDARHAPRSSPSRHS